MFMFMFNIVVLCYLYVGTYGRSYRSPTYRIYAIYIDTPNRRAFTHVTHADSLNTELSIYVFGLNFNLITPNTMSIESVLALTNNIICYLQYVNAITHVLKLFDIFKRKFKKKHLL